MPEAKQCGDAQLAVLGASVGELLLTRGLSVVAAESCTGGWIAKVLTDVPGSSNWFECGVVAYSYEAKEALLGVQSQTLERAGAVSQETVVEMVSGAMARYGASVAVAVTAGAWATVVAGCAMASPTCAACGAGVGRCTSRCAGATDFASWCSTAGAASWCSTTGAVGVTVAVGATGVWFSLAGV